MNGDYDEYPSLSPFTEELQLQGKWWKEKFFLQIQSINVMYPIVENMIVMHITKSIEISTSIEVCLISRVNINYMENNGKKSFSCKSKHR